MSNITFMKQSDMLKCPFAIIAPEHYRPDGTCKCNELEEQLRMIREWEYTAEDFDDIPTIMNGGTNATN